MNKKQMLIAGAGNLWRSDDGIGIIIIEKLRVLYQQNPHNDAFQGDIVDIGTDGLSLLDILPNYQKAIIIDAVNMSAPPGTIKIFSPIEAKIKISSDALSTHGFGLAEMLKLAEQLNITTAITIIGIQPQNLSFGNTLSTSVKNSIDEVIAKIHQLIEQKFF